MLYEKERQAIIDTCLDMVRDRLTLGTSGNVSVRIDDHVCITPSGFDYDRLTPADITVMDLEGTIVEGNPKPSSEVPMHLLVYRETDAEAVIHTHPRYGTVVGTLVDETPLIHYMLAPCGGPVRVVIAAVWCCGNQGGSSGTDLTSACYERRIARPISWQKPEFVFGLL